MNKDTVLYKNDLKYKKQRCVDIEYLQKIGHPILKENEIEINQDMDSLEYRFKECIINGGSTLDLSHMDLDKLPRNMPLFIENLFCSDNSLTSLKGIDKLTKLKVLDCSSNQLTSLKYTPKTVEEICCKNNKLQKISVENLPNLCRLDFSHNSVHSLLVDVNKNVKLQIVVCNNNLLTKIPSCNSLKRLVCRYNNISETGSLQNLEELDCSHNKFVRIENYPKLQHIYCSNNNIIYINNLDSLTLLDCTDNPLSIIPFFKNLEDLNCSLKDTGDLQISSRYVVKESSINKLNQMRIRFKKLLL